MYFKRIYSLITDDKRNASWNFSQQYTSKSSAFCSFDISSHCNRTQIRYCEVCSQASIWIFFVFVISLAMTILVGNLFVIVYVSTSNRTNRGIIRAAISISEILTSVLLCTITIPNIVWTYYSTPLEIFLETHRSLNSFSAVMGGVFLLFCTTSFLFLLTFMSYMHFAAVRWPIRSRYESKKSLMIKISVVTLLAMIPATYPCWFPDVFHFTYVYYSFIYMPNIKTHGDPTKHGYIFIVLLLPAYVLMASFSIATAVTIYRNGKLRRNMTARNYSNTIKSEAKASYKLLALMVIAFTITFVPSIIAYALSLIDDSNTIAILVCDYLTMCNGLMNLVIYWWKDNGFKTYMKKIYVAWSGKLSRISLKKAKPRVRKMSIFTVSEDVTISRL